MSSHHFDAVIFDLDGVITQTALVHSVAWKEMFDEYLGFREKKYGEEFREFSHTNDYLPFVDGKPRYQGVASFLESRGIDIPFGDPSDPTETESVCGLGNRKNIAFNTILDRDGVVMYESTVDLIHELVKENIRIGVASSSKNCKPVLEATGLLDLFETRVDGIVSAEMDLKGKPEPDIFKTACDNLGVDYDRAVIVEDAVSGVMAGRTGNFGLCLGIAREENVRELLINGADIVVEDISALGGIAGIDKWFENGLDEDNWSILYHDYDQEKEKSREALLTVGNGYFGTRGAMDECSSGEMNYPGTYLAGLFNRRISRVEGREIENEDFVNCPDWTRVTFKIDDGEWFNPNRDTILEIRRRLSFRDGLLSRSMIIVNADGKKTKVRSERIASMEDPHLAVMHYDITPLNYTAKITIRSVLDGNIINDGVERYRELDQRHLEVVSCGGDKQRQYLMVQTTQSEIQLAQSSHLMLKLDSREIKAEFLHIVSEGKIETEIEINVGKGHVASLEKLTAIYTSRECGPGLALEVAKEKSADIPGFLQVYIRSADKWAELWKKADIHVEGDRLAQKLLRMHIYHLLVTASPHNRERDAGIPARGLHGEAYRGHIFWDELYIMPFYDLHFPEVAKSILMYRYRRLDKAREYARENGYEGAMFPWQSGSDGREETQILHLNPVSGEWGDDYSSLQRHISLAVAYNIWDYFWITRDLDFMYEAGAEMLFEICRLWSSKAAWDDEKQRFSIDQVMGPDEFHEHLPGSGTGGLKDNSYTNLMVAWMFKKALAFLNENQGKKLDNVLKRINLRKEETFHWDRIRKKLNLKFSEDGILAQFDGYFGLKELDWDYYREKYGNIHRMDRLLKAEGKSPDDYKLAKQADTLMAFYNLGEDVVRQLLKDLDFPAENDLLEKNFHYYIGRTSHGSTLSHIVHASLASCLDIKDIARDMYMDALTSDYKDVQGGTTAEGIHAGVMGATALFVIQFIAGINFRGAEIGLDPRLPDGWKKVKFNFGFRKNYYTFELFKNKVLIELESPDKQSVEIRVKAETFKIEPGSIREIIYNQGK